MIHLGQNLKKPHMPNFLNGAFAWSYLQQAVIEGSKFWDFGGLIKGMSCPLFPALSTPRQQQQFISTPPHPPPKKIV